VLDLDDPSMSSPDPLVHMGITMGETAADWDSQEDKLDFPIKVYPEEVDENNLPISLIPAEIVTDGDTVEFRTTAPGKVGFLAYGQGDFSLHAAMIRTQIDPSRSRPGSPPDLAEGIEMPETAGKRDESGPRGLLCGAMLAESFQSIPFPDQMAPMCPEFTPCEEGQNPAEGECSSMLDLIRDGCGDLLNPVGGPDADVNGDGVKDAYSMVIGTASERIKIVGITENSAPIPE